jgi:cytochrome c oxidase subunit 3
MSATGSPERKRLHPHKFTLWIAMGSIIMMFAGLTSAYVVKESQSNWLEFALPKVFWYSTFVILLSSLTIHLALKSFKARQKQRYKVLITVTAFLGLLFAALQGYGFYDLYYNKGIQIFGVGSNPSASFLGIITGLHVLHVLGGVVALIVIFIRAYSTKVKMYNSVPVEIASTYWHFVDILWLYLFVFLTWFG